MLSQRSGVLNIIGNTDISAIEDIYLKTIKARKMKREIKLQENSNIEVVFSEHERKVCALIPYEKIKELVMDEAIDIITEPVCSSSSCAENGFCECEPINENCEFECINISIEESIKCLFESACNEYADLFAKKHGMLFDGWESDYEKIIACFDDHYYVKLHVIRQNIDEKHGVDTFFNWYRSVENGSTVNYSSYVKGAPITYNE